MEKKEEDEYQIFKNENNTKHIQSSVRSVPDSFVNLVFKKFSNSIRIIGPIFSIVLLIFMLIIVHYTYAILLKYYIIQNHILSIWFICFFQTIFLFNMIINFLLSCLVKPGEIKELITNTKLSNNNTLNQEELDFKELLSNSFNIFLTRKKPLHNRIINNSSFSTIVNNNKRINNDHNYYFDLSDLEFCSKCLQYKPLRTHHCSICNSCIPKMDHHCAWINNCIGLKNNKFFLLFVTYLFISSIVSTYFSIYIYFDKEYLDIFNEEINNEFFLCFAIGIVGILLSFSFVGFNWFLLATGKTTLEFFQSIGIRNRHLEDRINFTSCLNYKFNKFLDNFYVIFGTRNMFYAFFMPWSKHCRIQLSGLEYSELFIMNFENNV